VFLACVAAHGRWTGLEGCVPRRVEAWSLANGCCPGPGHSGSRPRLAGVYLLHPGLLELAGGAAGWERILSSVCVSHLAASGWVGKVAAYPPTKQAPTARRRWSAAHTPPPTLPNRLGGFLACFACALPGPGFASGYLESSPPASPGQAPNLPVACCPAHQSWPGTLERTLAGPVRPPYTYMYASPLYPAVPPPPRCLSFSYTLPRPASPPTFLPFFAPVPDFLPISLLVPSAASSSAALGLSKKLLKKPPSYQSHSHNREG
jgi:hypothetical protein